MLNNNEEKKKFSTFIKAVCCILPSKYFKGVDFVIFFLLKIVLFCDDDFVVDFTHTHINVTVPFCLFVLLLTCINVYLCRFLPQIDNHVISMCWRKTFFVAIGV